MKIIRIGILVLGFFLLGNLLPIHASTVLQNTIMLDNIITNTEGWIENHKDALTELYVERQEDRLEKAKNRIADIHNEVSRHAKVELKEYKKRYLAEISKEKSKLPSFEDFYQNYEEQKTREIQENIENDVEDFLSSVLEGE